MIGVIGVELRELPRNMFRFSGERPVLLIQERSDALADVELGVGVVALVQLGSLDLIAGFATRNGTCGRRTDPRPLRIWPRRGGLCGNAQIPRKVCFGR